MGTDLNSYYEYVDVYLDDVKVTTCGGNYCQTCCRWYTSCYFQSNRPISSSQLKVKLQYSNSVGNLGVCPYNANNGNSYSAHAMARVIFS